MFKTITQNILQSVLLASLFDHHVNMITFYINFDSIGTNCVQSVLSSLLDQHRVLYNETKLIDRLTRVTL